MPKKMKWSNTDLGAVYGCSRQTFAGYVADLVQQRKFKKTNPGKFYSRKDVEDLAKLLGFDLQEAIDHIKNKNEK